MADFDTALQCVLQHEDAQLSGVVTHDTGGRTRFGIAERSHPNLPAEFFDGDADAALAIAREIYRSDYWDAVRGNQIRDQALATKVFDMAVNMGCRQAVVLLQRALHALGFTLADDGILGPQTLAAANACAASQLLEHLRTNCAAFYQHIVAVRPESKMYLRGWLLRAQA